MRKDRLIKAMERNGHNAVSLAEVLGVSDRQVRRWLNGENNPHTDVAAQLSAVLNVSTDYLLGLSDNPNPSLKIDNLTDEESAVLSAMRHGDRLAAIKILANTK